MKKVIALVLMAVMSVGFVQAQDKIGHINVDQLISLMPETKAAQTELEREARALEQQLDEMQGELEAKVQKYRESEATMTDLTRETKYNEIQDLDRRIQDFQMKAQEQLQKKQEDLLIPVLEKAQNAISKVANANGFTYILDSSQSKGVVIFKGNGTDIMPLVKKELGITE
jgi:outer membrane protein